VSCEVHIFLMVRRTILSPSPSLRASSPRLGVVERSSGWRVARSRCFSSSRTCCPLTKWATWTLPRSTFRHTFRRAKGNVQGSGSLTHGPLSTFVFFTLLPMPPTMRPLTGSGVKEVGDLPVNRGLI